MRSRNSDTYSGDEVTGVLNRKDALFHVGLFATFCVAAPKKTNAVSNPLNLKGFYWETGQLYQKSDNTLSSDSQELLEYLVKTAQALEKLSQSDVLLDGKFGELSRMLRGGVISENKIRLQSYALIDTIEDDRQEYLARELFRVFLKDFDILDRTVEAASRQSKLDGGMIETLGLAVVSPFGAVNEVARITAEPNFGTDSRITVLAAMQETSKDLLAFIQVAKGAIAKGPNED